MVKSLLLLTVIVGCALAINVQHYNLSSALSAIANQPTYTTSQPEQCATNFVKTKIPHVDGREWVYSKPFKITCGKVNQPNTIIRYSVCGNPKECDNCINEYSKC